MLDNQLLPAHCPKLVDIQPVEELHTLADRYRNIRLTEGDRLERAAAVGRRKAQLKMPLADNTPVEHGEMPVEQRFRECLTPGRPVPQRFGDLQREFRLAELAVTPPAVNIVNGIRVAQHLFLKGGAELIEPLRFETQAGRHGVTAKPFDEAGVTCVYRREHVPQMNA